MRSVSSDGAARVDEWAELRADAEAFRARVWRRAMRSGNPRQIRIAKALGEIVALLTDADA